MRAVLLALFVLMSPPALAAEPGDSIEATIQNQITAFMADDFETAFSYASPNIKRMFGSSERFGMMVQQGYPMVWRPAEVQFRELREIAGALWQQVLVTDGAGVQHLLDYQMIETPEGWQINGVQLLRAPGVGV